MWQVEDVRRSLLALQRVLKFFESNVGRGLEGSDGIAWVLPTYCGIATHMAAEV